MLGYKNSNIYYRIGYKSRNSEGNGLGQSTIKRVIDMSGGTIAVQSRLDEFTKIKTCSNITELSHILGKL
jgi:sensor histidine kinase regulating citrate/malate metabolism